MSVALDQKSERYMSRDFWRTTNKIVAKVPNKLIHRDVAGNRDAGSQQFTDERNHPVNIVDLPALTMSMTLGGLLPGQLTNRHRHSYETVLYVIEGAGTTWVEGEAIEWKKGDALYIPVWAWHQHRNASETEQALYIACENAPLLQNLGGIALREEQGRDF